MTPDMIRFACPECRRHFDAPSASAGRVVSCGGCGTQLQIPAQQPASGVAAGPPPLSIPVASFREDSPIEVSMIRFVCSMCQAHLKSPPQAAGQFVTCACGQRLRVPQAKTMLVLPDRVLTADEQRRARKVAEIDRQYLESQDSGGVTACGALSCFFGCVAFLVCPPFFGLVGITLGIITVCIAKDKALGAIGICVSVVGACAGAAIGYQMGTRMFTR